MPLSTTAARPCHQEEECTYQDWDKAKYGLFEQQRASNSKAQCTIRQNIQYLMPVQVINKFDQVPIESKVAMSEQHFPQYMSMEKQNRQKESNKHRVLKQGWQKKRGNTHISQDVRKYLEFPRNTGSNL